MSPKLPVGTVNETLRRGEHRKQGVAPSVSPSMDIQVSSNFERLVFDLYDREGPAVGQLMSELSGKGAYALSQGALARLRGDFDSASVSEAETADSIRNVLQSTGRIICPHTAVGVKVSQNERGDLSFSMVTLATAHAAKFPDAVEAACGVRPELPPPMADLFERPERVVTVANDLQAVEELIKREIGR